MAHPALPAAGVVAAGAVAVATLFVGDDDEDEDAASLIRAREGAYFDASARGGNDGVEQEGSDLDAEEAGESERARDDGGDTTAAVLGTVSALLTGRRRRRYPADGDYDDDDDDDDDDDGDGGGLEGQFDAEDAGDDVDEDHGGMGAAGGALPAQLPPGVGVAELQGYLRRSVPAVVLDGSGGTAVAVAAAAAAGAQGGFEAASPAAGPSAATAADAARAAAAGEEPDATGAEANSLTVSREPLPPGAGALDASGLLSLTPDRDPVGWQQASAIPRRRRRGVVDTSAAMRLVGGRSRHGGRAGALFADGGVLDPDSPAVFTASCTAAAGADLDAGRVVPLPRMCSPRTGVLPGTLLLLNDDDDDDDDDDDGEFLGSSATDDDDDDDDDDDGAESSSSSGTEGGPEATARREQRQQRQRRRLRRRRRRRRQWVAAAAALAGPTDADILAGSLADAMFLADLSAGGNGALEEGCGAPGYFGDLDELGRPLAAPGGASGRRLLEDEVSLYRTAAVRAQQACEDLTRRVQAEAALRTEAESHLRMLRAELARREAVHAAEVQAIRQEAERVAAAHRLAVGSCTCGASGVVDEDGDHFSERDQPAGGSALGASTSTADSGDT